MLNFTLPDFLNSAERFYDKAKMSFFGILFAAKLKLQPNLLKEVHYALVAHVNFQKNSCARINNKKQNYALSLRHFKHITNNPVSPVKYSNILSIKFTNAQILRILIL